MYRLTVLELCSDWELNDVYTVHVPCTILFKVTVPLAYELTALTKQANKH